ncbi:phosphopantetheine-binding protein [Streptomyces sp. NPDC020667]|uniref:phosphopantetheine-binding protein n=1 Tax=Streptomyces sp. NPDC020667 TaxID=3154895 RepID=UPI0034084335
MTRRTPEDDPGARAVALIAETLPPWADRATIVPAARLREDLGLDSLAKVALAARISEDIGADEEGVAVEEFTTLLTVGDVQDLCRRLSAAPPAGTLGRLVHLLARLGPEPLDTTRLDPSAPLRDLGLPSMVLVDFFVRIETEFAFTWDEDTPPQTFATLTALARHIDDRTAPPATRPAHREHAP